MPLSDRKYVLYTLATVNFTHIVDSMLIMPLGDIFIQLFGINAQEYSYLVSSYAFAAFLSSLAGVFFLDRFGRKSALLFVYTGFSVGTLLCAFANTYAALLTLRFITGLFGGMIGALVLSIVSDLYPFKERGRAMGVLFAAFSAASALGVPIGIFLAAKGSWQWPFFLIGSMGLLITGFIHMAFPTMSSHLSLIDQNLSIKKTIRAITGDVNQLRGLTAAFVVILAHFLIIPFISPYMIRNVGLTQMEISYQFFLGGAATIVTAPFIGRLTDRYGVMRVFTIVMLLSLVPTYMITNLPVSSIYVALTWTTLFFILASGRMIPSNAVITAAAPLSNRGSFMSIKSALQQLAIFAASLVSGWLVSLSVDGYVGYQYVGYLSIAFGLLAVALVSRVRVAQGN